MNILLKEVKEKHRLCAVFRGKNINLPNQVASLIEEHWKRSLSKEKNLFCGEVFCVESIKETENGDTTIFLTKSDYAHYLATIDRVVPEKWYCKSLYTSVILITRDRFLVFGKKAGNTSSPGQVECTGGGVSERCIETDGSISLLGNAKSEIEEEFYLDPNDKYHILESFLIRFIKTGGDFGTVGIFFEARTPLLKYEFERFFSAKKEKEISLGKKPEFEELVFIQQTEGDVRSFLRQENIKRNDYMEVVLKKMVELK